MKRYVAIVCALLIMLGQLADVKTVSAAEDKTNTTYISSYEDLCKIRDNPSGYYELTRDIDLSGKVWTPLDFSGVLDGKGYSILNVNVTAEGKSTATTYDGNMKTYDTHFAGFFGKLTNAHVSDLNIVNIVADINTDEPCFVGGFAGYMDKAEIINSSVTGRLSLKTGSKMFGVGGMAGFGNGDIKHCNSDMTLVCVDTNKQDKDEQFMGGAYAAGYIGIDNCHIRIDGYDSDHGYVHNGGMVGMFAVYPTGNTFKSYITYNHVDGQITFFEDNADRRAYCKPYVGEVLHWTYDWGGCTEQFKTNEIFDYSKDLYPEKCATPSYVEKKVESTDESYGYTEYKCSGCGYTYTDNYILHKIDLKRIEEEKESSIQASIEQSQAESIAAEKATEPSTEKSVSKDTTKHFNIVPAIVAGSIAVVVLVVCVCIQSKRRTVRRRRRR